MGALLADHRVLWPYDVTAKPVPSGWSRHTTDFDDRFLQGVGDGETVDTNGGATTHSHTIQDHAHSQASHTHDVCGSSSGTCGGTITVSTVSASVTVPATVPTSHPSATHHHASTTSFGAQGSTTYGLATGLSTAAASNAKPASVRTILIKPDAGGQDVPEDGVGFFNGDHAPGWDECDGSQGAAYVDLDGKFLWIAEGGDDGGGSTTDILTHNHGGSAASHNHSPSGSHVHTINAIPASSGFSEQGKAGFPVSRIVNVLAHHTLDFSSETLADTSSETIPIGSAGAAPSYYTLLPALNATGGDDTPAGLILPYLGSLGALGGEWVHCDGTSGTPDLRGLQIKCTTTVGAVGTTGGVDSHTHTGTGHTHSGGGTHSHTITPTLLPAQYGQAAPTNTFIDFFAGDHNHTWVCTTENDPDAATAVPTVDAADGRYLFRRVYWTLRRVAGVRLRGSTWIRGSVRIR